MKRYALVYIDSLGCLGIRELWERCDQDAAEKMEFHRRQQRWAYCHISEVPQ